MITKLSYDSLGRASAMLHGVITSSSEVCAPCRRGSVRPAQSRAEHLKPAPARSSCAVMIAFAFSDSRWKSIIAIEPKKG
jgi:hypothetical protein